MAFNVAGTVQIPLEVFGSLVTEFAPSAVPEGVSPDNQDIVYAPHQFSSRPPLKKVFATPFPSSPTVTYGKSYVDPLGVIRNLYLDSNGVLYLENFSATPGTHSNLATVTPASYAKSVTAFGREYIAFSDGLHGSDVPLQYDGTNLDRVTQDGPGTPPTVANLVIAASPLNGTGPDSLVRSKNVVTATTSSAHGLQVGYQAQISGVSAQAVGFLTSITINNEDSPGIATVVMPAAHGLSPGLFVSIAPPPAVAVGGGVSSATLVGQVLTVNTATPHFLQAGAIVTIVLTGGTASTALAAPAGGWTATLTVASITGDGTFTCILPNTNTVNAQATGGTVSLNWPPDSGNPDEDLWEVLECPDDITFQVAITYVDGTWTGSMTGVLTPWDGTFFVTSVPSTTSFTYSSQGPDGDSTDVGTVTPQGQAAPGQHQVQLLFLTRNGYITAPSPPVMFVADGGQYLSITDIAIGPPNVVARILAFTGAAGAYFFYIPVPAQVNGQIVSTATQINDNTTTSIVLDFSDNTLFASLGTSIPGNDLANQVVLDGALGFGFYGERLITWGQRNVINNLLNMGFDGGTISGQITGWSGSGTAVAGHFSEGVSDPDLTQSFFEDAYGAPIGTPNTKYRARAWITASTTVTISSATTSFSSSVTLTAGAGGWAEGAFSLAMPATIPPDMVINLSSAGTVDDLSIIYADTPYQETILEGSYVDNPEAFDGVTGRFGPSDDTRKVMEIAILRGSLYLLTLEPSGRLHETVNNGVTEPSGWTVNEIGANCGVLSAFALSKSQADDASTGGGEEWFTWASSSGLRIFGGDQPWKISQEIQPDWSRINNNAYLTVWVVNDPVARVVYVGLPMGTATAPSLIYPMNYRELDTPYQIATSPPVHTAFSGKLVATDYTRKWTRWNMTMNGGALMYRSANQLTMVVFGGDGQFPGDSTGFGNVYIFPDTDVCGYADDDYGQFFPYYTTYFFAGTAEIALQVGAVRKMCSYFTMYCPGIGHVRITPLVDNLSNPWPLTCLRSLYANPNFDLEWTAASVTGQRIAFQIAGLP